MSEWNEHTGDANPVGDDDLVIVVLRGGDFHVGKPVKAGTLDWSVFGVTSDIVKWKLYDCKTRGEGE